MAGWSTYFPQGEDKVNLNSTYNSMKAILAALGERNCSWTDITWSPNLVYYQGDFCLYDSIYYLCITSGGFYSNNNQGKQPDSSPNDWQISTKDAYYEAYLKKYYGWGLGNRLDPLDSNFCAKVDSLLDSTIVRYLDPRTLDNWKTKSVGDNLEYNTPNNITLKNWTVDSFYEWFGEVRLDSRITPYYVPQWRSNEYYLIGNYWCSCWWKGKFYKATNVSPDISNINKEPDLHPECWKEVPSMVFYPRYCASWFMQVIRVINALTMIKYVPQTSPYAKGMTGQGGWGCDNEADSIAGAYYNHIDPVSGVTIYNGLWCPSDPTRPGINYPNMQAQNYPAINGVYAGDHGAYTTWGVSAVASDCWIGIPFNINFNFDINFFAITYYDTPNTNHITDFCGLPYHLGYNSFIGTRTNQTNSWFKIGNALAIPDPAQVTFASFPTVARVMTAGWQERAELRMATIDFKVDGGFDFIEGS